ncbi:MAG: diguanylate cyclase, partial [Halothiobacillaceae bacterium]
MADILHSEIIEPNIVLILDEFYEALLRHPSTAKLLANFSIADLKRTQRAYLLSLGQGFLLPHYFEGRLKIGLAHVRVGLKPALYQSAYRVLQQSLIDHIPPHHEHCRALIAFILKITMLDMSLAIESYEQGITTSLKDSLATLEDEKLHLADQIATDALTGVLSRKRILEILKTKLEPHQPCQPISVLMADLDHFKRINDTYGHLFGDAVLKDAALRMRTAIRSVNALGRYGGEEFLIVLSDTTLKQAQEIAERVREKVAKEPLNINHTEVHITISIGIASGTLGESPEHLIERADSALYAAKRQGRNCVACYDPQEAGI